MSSSLYDMTSDFQKFIEYLDTCEEGEELRACRRDPKRAFCDGYRTGRYRTGHEVAPRVREAI